MRKPKVKVVGESLPEGMTWRDVVVTHGYWKDPGLRLKYLLSVVVEDDIVRWTYRTRPTIGEMTVATAFASVCVGFVLIIGWRHLRGVPFHDALGAYLVLAFLAACGLTIPVAAAVCPRFARKYPDPLCYDRRSGLLFANSGEKVVENLSIEHLEIVQFQVVRHDSKGRVWKDPEGESPNFQQYLVGEAGDGQRVRVLIARHGRGSKSLAGAFGVPVHEILLSDDQCPTGEEWLKEKIRHE